MNAVELIPTRCAICGTEGNATEVYPARLGSEALCPAVFSARRLPDRMHFRLARCNACGLVRSDPIASPELLTRLYAQSSFDYTHEVRNIQRTYGHYLAKLVSLGAKRGALLEIGCGNGFFLEEALDRGFATVRGVEPSSAAVRQASSRVRDGIVEGTMRPGLFPAETFDVVCMFQTLDHLPDPVAVITECQQVLKPGGWMLSLNHNIEAVSARLLGERSPVVDIEHTYLYSPSTMARLFCANGFQVRRIGPVWNWCSVRYAIHLFPLPARPKTLLMATLHRSVAGRALLALPLGNLYLMAQRNEPHA